MLPVNRLHNTAAPALHITIPSSTSKNGTISRFFPYFAPKGLGWVQRLTSGQSAFMMRIANEQPSG